MTDDEGRIRELVHDGEHGQIYDAAEVELDGWLAARSRRAAMQGSLL